MRRRSTRRSSSALSRLRSKVARKSVRGRRRDSMGRLLPKSSRSNPRHHRHDNPSLRGRARDSRGRLLPKRGRRHNPFDRVGDWHREPSGRYGHVPRGGFASKTMAAKRSRFTRSVARHRSRDASGHFLNPVGEPMDTMGLDNPFIDSRGRKRRNDGRFAKKRRSKKRASPVGRHVTARRRSSAPRRTHSRTRAAIGFKAEMARIARGSRDNPKKRRAKRRSKRRNPVCNPRPVICNPRHKAKRRSHRRSRR